MNGCSTHSIWLICPSSLAAFKWGVLATLNALLLLEIMDKPSVIWFTALSGPTRITRLQILSRRNGAPPFSVKTEESDPHTHIPFAVHLGFQQVYFWGRLVQWRTRYLLEMNWRPHMSLTWGIDMGQQKYGSQTHPLVAKNAREWDSRPPALGLDPGVPSYLLALTTVKPLKRCV